MRILGEVAEDYFRAEARLAQLKQELIQTIMEHGIEEFFNLNIPVLRREFDPFYPGRSGRS